MSTWWTPETRPEKAAEEAGRRAAGPVPELLDATSAAFRASVQGRINSFTPDWTNLRADDAGVALTFLLGEMFQPVLQRVNRLPEKLLIEDLQIAGIALSPASAARSVLQLQVTSTVPGPVAVPAGFQVATAAASGDGRVIFETERSVVATPGRLAEAHVQFRRVSTRADAGALAEGTASLRAFGDRPVPGAALWLGLDTPVRPSPSLSLQLLLAEVAGRPPSVSRGGVSPPPSLPPSVLRWDVLASTAAGPRLAPAEVVLDETEGLKQSGIVELGLPDGWEPATPPGIRSRQPLRWLRIQLVHGGYLRAPALAAVRLNAVSAIAARTIFGEVLEPVGGGGEEPVQMRISQIPVLPGSLVIEVDETATDVFGLAATSGPQRWQEVASLAGAGPDRRVFTVNYATGIVTFGDGVNGARVPAGFRNVRAVRYQAGGGPAGAIKAGTRLSAVTAVPFVTGAVSPDAASGGADTEPVDAALRRGPYQIRSRGRAVTVADYALLAPQAEGAEIARAHAAAGFHPDIPGAAAPGLVGVLVVPVRHEAGPPQPTQGELDAVARHLVSNVAPAGVQIVVGAPRYEQVRVEGRLVASPDADLGAVVRAAIAAVDSYLDPVTGGEDRQGWPFGAPVRHAALLRWLLSTVSGLRAVPLLNLVVDGRRLPPCADHAIAPHGLPFPAIHELVPIADGGVAP